jgi:hypothetical protein
MRCEVTIAACPIRFVIVHYHIFKNAGSTIKSILAREFPGRFASLHGPTRDVVLNGGHLAEFLEKNSTVSAVTSHHLCYPKPAIRNTVLFDCCFLRHPLERVQSVYSYLRKIECDDPLCRLAHRHSSADFVKFLLERSPHLISDVQVHRLVNGGAFTRPASEMDLEQATRVLLEMAIPGVTGMFDESLVAAEYFLNPAFPGIRLEYVRQNVSAPSELDPAERQNQLRRLWGATAYEELARLNEFDLEIYRRAKEEVGRRLALVPKFDEKLLEFRSRLRSERSRQPQAAGVWVGEMVGKQD